MVKHEPDGPRWHPDWGDWSVPLRKYFPTEFSWRLYVVLQVLALVAYVLFSWHLLSHAALRTHVFGGTIKDDLTTVVLLGALTFAAPFALVRVPMWLWEGWRR